jgi:hypothetical protein
VNGGGDLGHPAGASRLLAGVGEEDRRLGDGRLLRTVAGRGVGGDVVAVGEID